MKLFIEKGGCLWRAYIEIFYSLELVDITGLFVVCVLAITILYRILSLLAPGFVFMDLFLVFYGEPQTVHENGIREPCLNLAALTRKSGVFWVSWVVKNVIFCDIRMD